MRVHRLTWSGVRMEMGDVQILIDPLDADGIKRFDEQEFPKGTFVPAGEPGRTQLALITHRHSDHYNAATLKRHLAPDGLVLCTASDEEAIAEQGFAVKGLQAYEEHVQGEVHIHAVPAVDGLGASQTSWVVATQDGRIFHGGDTLWHGYWWQIADRLGPFSAAFLPINGAKYFDKEMQPDSHLPMTMTPKQAVVAADILRAELLCPMHYDLYHTPGIYEELPDAAQQCEEEGRRRGIQVKIAEPGEYVI